MDDSQDRWQWFNQARYGLFIHWGAYAAWARGEQVLFREHLDQNEYARAARAWNPARFNAGAWADLARRGGFRYAVLTARHHDGFCLWNSGQTRYTSAAQAAGRDFVREYVEAFRAAGLRVGLYYSLADWRIPAYWDGPARDPQGWERFRQVVHSQVEELLTQYGKIDVIWFDGAWPHPAQDWRALELVQAIRRMQPDILINNRLGKLAADADADPNLPHADGGAGAGESRELGDFGTPEHTITAEAGRLWESCQVSTWRLWGYARGERWRPADVMLDMLVESAGKGGNLLLNVGPTAEGEFPPEFIERAEQIGQWLETHGEAIYGSDAGEVCEFVTCGRQTRKGNNLYLVVRFWDGRRELHLAGLETRVQRAVLLTTGQELAIEQSADHLLLRGLPAERPTALFPVIRLECAGPPAARAWAVDRLWSGDAARMTDWARAYRE